MDKCCGTCKWWSTDEEARWGWCEYVIPPLPFVVPPYCTTDETSGWRGLEDSEGTDCPCFIEKED